MNERTTIKVGDWVVTPALNLLESAGHSIKLEPRAMDVLVYLINARDQVVSADELLREVWQGRVFDDGTVYKKINQLRKALGDDSHGPRYIETIPKRGYRLVAEVTLSCDAHSPTTFAPPEDAGTAPAPRRRHVRVAAIVGVVALLVGASAVVVISYMQRGPALQFTPLSFEQKSDQRWMVWSPDSRAIAFSARPRPTEPYQVFVRYLDAPAATQITNLTEGVHTEAWTSTGQILFVSARAPAGLWSTSTLGGEPEPVLPFPHERTEAGAITRDGATFALFRDGGVWAGSLKEGALKQYEPAPFASRSGTLRAQLAFSPDGRQLLLMRNRTSGEEAWLMPYPADPSRPPRRILEDLPVARGTPAFSWMPDNRRIVVSTADARAGPERLYVADTVSGEFRLLSGGTTRQTFPAVAPDGDKLVFTERIGDVDVVALDLQTAAVTALIATNDPEETPAWAMSAPALTYVAVRNGEPEIWLREPGRPDRKIVTASDFPAGTTEGFMGPDLSPDASRIIYGRIEAKRTGLRLWISAVAGGSPVRLTQSSEFEHPGSWSPDGNWYVYPQAEREEGSITLKKVRTTGHAEPETLVTNVKRIGLRAMQVPVWSPSGQWILYENDGLTLLSADGKESRDLDMKNALCAFARDAERLYCLRAPEADGSRPLVAVSFDGHVERVIGSVAAEHEPYATLLPALRLTVAPDGKSVVYGAGNTTVNLWLIEGLNAVPPP